MRRAPFKIALIITVAMVASMFIVACGGGSGSGSEETTYNGNTEPAVADTTTVTPLAQGGLNSASAGFPVVQAFFFEEPGGGVTAPPAAPAAAQPLAAYYGTYVTMTIPPEAVIDGADLGGGGTLTLAGTLTIWVEDQSAGGATWTVMDVTMNGTVAFDGYYNGSDMPELTGTVSLTDSTMVFSNDPVEFSLSTMDFVGDPGFPMFTDANVTFAHVAVGTGADSYSLGEGDLQITLSDTDVDVIVNSLAAVGQGEAYKLEDCEIYVAFNGDTDDIFITGYSGDYATVYHSTLGKFYFDASITEDTNLIGGIISGSIYISTDGLVDDADIFLDYNPIDGTFYNIYMDIGSGPEIVEKGYVVDWEFTPDAGAPDIIN